MCDARYCHVMLAGSNHATNMHCSANISSESARATLQNMIYERPDTTCFCAISGKHIATFHVKIMQLKPNSQDSRSRFLRHRLKKCQEWDKTNQTSLLWITKFNVLILCFNKIKDKDFVNHKFQLYHNVFFVDQQNGNCRFCESQNLMFCFCVSTNPQTYHGEGNAAQFFAV